MLSAFSNTFFYVSLFDFKINFWDRIIGVILPILQNSKLRHKDSIFKNPWWNGHFTPGATLDDIKHRTHFKDYWEITLWKT